MLEVIKFSKELEERWDQFVLNKTINGTFLQTRRFLNYHPLERFIDASILVMQGTSIVAVIPACEVNDKEGKHFISHKGSTFGGIVLAYEKFHVTDMEDLFPVINEYFDNNGYNSVSLSMTSDIFSKKNQDLFDYYFYKDGWKASNEICSYIDLNHKGCSFIDNMSASRRRDYRKSLLNGLTFRKLESYDDIKGFYQMLSDNLKKYNAVPVHTLDELLEFKNYRLKDEISFYGVYLKEELVSGAMIFSFGNQVFHTQYLAQNPETLRSKLFPMEYLNCSLIQLAYESGYKFFSFGPSTLNEGRYLNVTLASFKEGFGCDFCNKWTYKKVYR